MKRKSLALIVFCALFASPAFADAAAAEHAAHGTALRAAGRLEEAIAEYKAALRLLPPPAESPRPRAPRPLDVAVTGRLER